MEEAKMAKKNYLPGILVVVMLFGSVSALSAEESGFDGFPVLSSFSAYSFEGFGLDFMADSSVDYQDYTKAERTNMILLNLAFGIGSYTNGHIWDGVLLTSLEVVGIFLMALPSIAGWQAGLSEKGKEAASNGSSSSGTSSGKYYDDRLTPETNYSVWCYLGGGALLITDIVLSIVKPLKYHKPQAATARIDDPRNWAAALYPAQGGKLTGRITFTARL
jgi:hypothetical protein